MKTSNQSTRPWDAAVVAAILALVLLGWLTATGGHHAGPPRPAHSAAHTTRGNVRR
jgi:VIT1/CCC1 family predicted Fe2+/Mn2+ transporter